MPARVKYESCLEHFFKLVHDGWRVLSISKEEAKMLSPDGRRIELVDLLHDLVTYYWNSYDNDFRWTNPGNMVDGSVDTDAVTTDLDVGDSSIELPTTNSPGADLGIITKREYRMYGLTTNAEIGPVGDEVTLQGVIVVTGLTISPEGWSSYYDVTAIGSLDWADLPNAFTAFLVTETAGGGVAQISRVELRITYTPPVGLENKSANMGSKMVAAGLI